MRWFRRVVVVMVLVVAGGLVGVLAFMVVDNARVAHEALSTRDQTAAAAGRRIDALTAQIDRLESQITADGGVIGELVAQIQVLEEQVKELGGRPIIVETTTATTAPTTTQPQSPSPTPVTTPPSPAPPTTTTTTPAHGPPTSTPGQKCIVIVCVG